MRELSFRFLCPLSFFRIRTVKSSSTREKERKNRGPRCTITRRTSPVFLAWINVSLFLFSFFFFFYYVCLAKPVVLLSNSLLSFRFRLGPTSCSATTTSETTKSPLLPFFSFLSFFFLFPLLSQPVHLYSQGSPVERNSNLKYEKIPR